MDSKIIEVSDLTKDYGFGRGVFDVSFHVGKGEVFGFLGPNGAGKSTTIRHLMGFSKPDSGNTKIFGKETFSNYHQILQNVGYIPGEIALPAGLTGHEFLRMMMDMQHCKDDSHLKKLLDIFELDPSGETKRMSLGVKRKLAVVTAFMNDPDVLIMDEPTSGLDPEMQQVFIDYVKEEKSRGKTILLSSHIFSEVDATCDRIAIIKDGHIVSDFVADDLKHATRKEYEVTFDDSDSYRSFQEFAKGCDYLEIIDSNDSKNRLRLVTDDKYINQVVGALAKYKITGLHHRKETLEDYFMSYYKEDKEYGGAFAG
jgi:ABC-2 type transport system ATP-binding protein